MAGIMYEVKIGKPCREHQVIDAVNLEDAVDRVRRLIRDRGTNLKPGQSIAIVITHKIY